MRNEYLLNALVMKLEGEAAMHEANITVYMENPVGIGEHPQIIESIESEVAKLAEQTQYLVNEYVNDPTKATVDRLAQEMEKSPKSIIGKLSREGVYRRSVYKTKTGESPVTKEQLVRDIEDVLGMNHESLTGLEKSPKNILKQLRDSLT
jgi:hypothetical protein